jgi:hypothetical protein
MSILDFTTDLFRDPTNLRAFVDDPNKALHDAGLPDATPDQVHDLLPVVAESMPPDHPLQTVVGSLDPVAALQHLDFDELSIDVHQHHHVTSLIGKVLADVVCRPEEDDGEETIHVGNWHVDVDKAVGDVTDDSLVPPVDDVDDQPADHYPEPEDDHVHGHDHALDDGPVDLDLGALAWGKAIE